MTSKADISKSIKNLFKAISQKDNPKFASPSISEGWPLMFPCLLWNGKGGPDSCIHAKVSLREWINYVIQVPPLDFRKNIIFISFANIVLRRQRITGLTSHKPISRSVEQAVKELVRISQSSRPTDVPEATLNALSRKVGAYVDDLPGSFSDMRKFRNDILSMMKKHGPPTFFLTLSSADSMWPEGFVAASDGKITLQQARELSAVERADLMAQNPVALTEVWTKRVQGFLDFVIKGESKPLGEIIHYVQKAEWQGRLSEHAHFLFWTKEGVPSLHLCNNGSLKGEQKHICFKAESLGSAMIHFYPKTCLEKDEYTIAQNETEPTESSKCNFQVNEFKSLPKEEIFQSVTQEPLPFHDYFSDGLVRKSINDLVRSVNLHSCSAYCANNGKTTCKSRFPFHVENKTLIKPVIDKNRNRSYRVHLRRNHSRVNPYSVPLLNFWRANMDLTVLCGSPFASIVYVTYYTSKLDKSSNIRDVLQKVKTLDEDTETKKVLRKLLINMDTCRATGLPEASSNLLLFPHRHTSSKILMLDTRSYLPDNDSSEEEHSQSSETLNSLLHNATKGNEGFALPEPKLYSNRPRKPILDKITQNYFNRPSMVFDIEQDSMVESRQMSMTEYIEKYKITHRRKLTNKKQITDKANKIVEPRELNDQDVVLDLKFRISPPNSRDPKWCAGTLALHVPHASIDDLLTFNGEKKNLVEAYEFYHSQKTTHMVTGEPIPLYSLLHDFEKNETDLYVATNTTKYLPLHPKNKKIQNVHDDLEQLYNESAEINDFSEEDDLDPDEYPSALTNASTNLKKEKCKSWNGNPYDEFLAAENPWSITFSDSSPITEPSDVSEEHRTFMSLVLAGKNPNATDENTEVEQALLYANGDREKAASQFLKRTMNECKNDEQRKAIKTVVDVLEAYYFGKYSKVSRESVKNKPVLTMIGVPGAGKSWVIGKIRTWIDIRFKITDVPYQSSEFQTLNQNNLSDPVTGNIRETITKLPEGKYGKSAAFAFSGAAAGIIKGFTVHHGFSFPINMNKQVKSGELPLPEMKGCIRTKLLECWSSVKQIIIDEIYMLKVEWLSLLDERLRQIFNSDLPFAGIPILLAGDPRQIVPVNGKALFTISKYFNNVNGPNPEITPYGIVSLSEREERGFLLYASSQFAIPLTKSVRPSNKEFADLNMSIAQYKLTSKHLEKVNQLRRPLNNLQNSPWIDSPWLFPTWEDVNKHLEFVTERAKKLKGIFRAWCPITNESSLPTEHTRRAVKSFYQSSNYVSAKFTCPLPYVDYFIGQIVCLKKNWNPTWKLFNNAKAFVVGIRCRNPDRQANPLMTMDEAIDMTLRSPESLKYDLLVKPLIPFTGPSALPNVPGIIEVPWVIINRKIAGCKFAVEGPAVYPANAFSHHQSQGSTFDRCVACINEKCRAYGMANVVTSRTPKPEHFAITEPVNLKILQPCPDTSSLVENEYVRLTRKAK